MLNSPSMHEPEHRSGLLEFVQDTVFSTSSQQKHKRMDPRQLLFFGDDLARCSDPSWIACCYQHPSSNEPGRIQGDTSNPRAAHVDNLRRWFADLHVQEKVQARYFKFCFSDWKWGSQPENIVFLLVFMQVTLWSEEYRMELWKLSKNNGSAASHHHICNFRRKTKSIIA
jgi:hypothetical protein